MTTHIHRLDRRQAVDVALSAVCESAACVHSGVCSVLHYWIECNIWFGSGLLEALSMKIPILKIVASVAKKIDGTTQSTLRD